MNGNTNSNQEKHSKLATVVTILAIVTILSLAFLFYYFSVQTASNDYVTPTASSNSIAKKPIVPTKIINFAAPDILPTVQQNGNCFANSISAPYRKDAWRCMIENAIYDPCFETKQKGFVFCQTNPLVADSVLIKLNKALPKVSVPENAKENWAWFLTLKDGTYCSPFTGTLPPLQGVMAYYGCSGAKNQVLVGELIEGTVWRARRAILVMQEQGAVIQSSQQVDISTIWK